VARGTEFMKFLGDDKLAKHLKMYLVSIIALWLSCVFWSINWILYYIFHYGFCARCIALTLGINALIAAGNVIAFMHWKKMDGAFKLLEAFKNPATEVLGEIANA